MRNEGIVELYAPRRTLIGRDGITKIPHFLQRLSSKCVLVVTDKGLIKVGTAGKVTAVLDNANIQYSRLEVAVAELSFQTRGIAYNPDLLSK